VVCDGYAFVTELLELDNPILGDQEYAIRLEGETNNVAVSK